MEIRKYVTIVEDLKRDGQRPITDKEHKRVAVGVVFTNPFAGKDVEDLSELTNWAASVTPDLVERAFQAAGLTKDVIESYGKAAIVGAGGELEHAAALLHPSLGKPFRECIGGGLAIIPSAKKMGFPGCTIDVPLHYKDAAFVRTHFDAMEFRVLDAPRDNEIVLILAVTNCGRPHPRVGGLTIDQAKKEDGLR